MVQLTEVYYPDLGTPSVRDLQFIVSDGETFAEREIETPPLTRSNWSMRGPSVYRQINTDKSGKYRHHQDLRHGPCPLHVLVDVTFESLTGQPYQLYALYDPLSTTAVTMTLPPAGRPAAGERRRRRQRACGRPRVRAGPRTDYQGTSDGWADLEDDYTMDWNYRFASKGNVVQTAQDVAHRPFR